MPSDSKLPVPAGAPSTFLKAVSLDPHYVPARLPSGKVVGVWGQAVVRKPDGALEALQVGDEVHKGDVILTSQDGIVQIEEDGTRFARYPAAGEPIVALNDLDNLDPTGAGIAGGGGGGLQEGLRVERASLVTSPSEYQFAFQNNGPAFATGDTSPQTTAPSLGVTSATVGEAAGFAQFSVNLGGASNTATTVQLTVHAGSATPGQDYQPTLEVSTDGGQTWTATDTVTLPAGQTQALVRVPVLQDSLVEGDETFTVTATRSAGSTSNDTATATITVRDDDATPTLSIGDVTVNETAGTATFTVTLSGASGQPVSVNYTTGDGTAGAGGDYTAANGALTFAPGETTKTITVAINDDGTFEGPETFNVSLSNPTNASITDGVGNGIIVDNDAAPTIAGIVPMAEGGAVPEGTPLVFNITLSNPSATATSFAYTVGGTATAGNDFTPATFSDGVTLVDGQLVVPAGVTSFTVTVPTVTDGLDEPNETVQLHVGTATATGTIVDVDATPTLSVNDVSVNENAGTATFTVTLSAASGQTVSVNYATADGSAAAGSDYAAANGTLTFAPGETTKTVTVTVNEDGTFEGPETFNVNLSNPSNATLADGLGVGTIVDNDVAPTIASIAPAAGAGSVPEGTDLVFTVTLSNASSTPSSFAYSLGGGTATAGTDYSDATFSNGVTLVNGQLVVPAGVTSFTVNVPTLTDGIDEPNETVQLHVGTATATGTIVDVDATPTLSVNDVSVNENAGTATFTVTLSAASGQTVSVNYATADGTASAGSDYVAANGTLTFAPGETTKTVTVTVNEDGTFEGPETFNVNLSNPSNATLADGLGVGTIVDNHVAPTIASIAPVAGAGPVPEGTDLVFTVTLSNPSATPSSFAYSLGAGTATAGTDYADATFSNGVTLVNGQLVVPAGVTSFTVNVPTLTDGIDEPNETVQLHVGTATATGTIVDVDATPTLSVNDVSVNENAGTATFTVTLSAASGQTVSVNYATADGSAAAGSDYVAANGTLTFAPGETTKTVTVTVNEDGTFEGPETFNVNLSNPSNATLADGLGVGTIVDNDVAPTITSIAPAAGAGSVPEGTDLVFTVTLSNASSTPSSFSYSLGGGTATAGTDYADATFSNGVTLVNGQLVVPAGVTSFSVTVPTLVDGLDEPNETVQLSIGSASATGTIVDNDTPPEGRDLTLSTPEDQPLALNLAHFQMNDAEQGINQAPTSVRIDTLPLAGVLTLNGVAVAAGQVITAADIAAGLLVYAPGHDGNGVAYAAFTFSVADAGGLFDPVPNTLTVDVAAVNDAPVHQLPGTQNMAEDGTLVFSVANGNALRVSDVDAGNANVTTTLAASHGTLTLGTGAGLVVSGDGTATVTITGTVDAINQALEGTRFSPAANYNGPAQITLDTQDLGNTGTGGNLTDHDVLTLNVTPVNDLPTIGEATAVLSEEALPHGIGADAGDATVRTGTIAITDVDGDSLSLRLAAPTQTLTSGGLALQWSGSGTADDPLIGSTVSGGTAHTVLQASIEWVNGQANGQAQYTVTLLGPVDHLSGGTPNDTLTLDFGVRADDGHGTPVQLPALHVTVEDDTPAALTPQHIAVNTQDTNLLMVLDTSGSMAETDGNSSGATRLEVAVSAMIKVLQGYDDAGNVMVTLVNFSDKGNVALPWMSAADAITWLQDPAHLTAYGNTNYDDALAKAQAAFDGAGKLDSAENVAYFFSDGRPNRPTNSAGINASEEVAWESFLKNHDIDAYAIGLGSGVPSSALDPVAYDGRNEHESADHTLVVTNLEQLDTVLASTLPDPISGHLANGSIPLADATGADGGFVRSLQVGSVTYTYDPHDAPHPISGAPDGSYTMAGDLLTVTMANGSLAVDMGDGSYTFRPNAAGNGQFSETVQYSISDQDGDIVSSSLAFNGQHVVYGGDGANVLSGTAGADIIIGGAGNDMLTGGLGSDVFAWKLADRGTTAAPAQDTITDFNVAAPGAGGDVLDLRDLLQGESANAATLDRYLDFTVSGGNTTLHVASQGATTPNATAAQDQTIVLSGVDLSSMGGNDTAIIQHLLDQGKLLVDQNGG